MPHDGGCSASRDSQARNDGDVYDGRGVEGLASELLPCVVAIRVEVSGTVCGVRRGCVSAGLHEGRGR